MSVIRIIPKLDIKGPNVIKGIQLEGIRPVGDPKKLAEQYAADGADELIFMDAVASLYERDFDFKQLAAVCESLFIPVTAGGGIRTLKDINHALRAGADKVAINTYALKRPAFLKEASREFGSQCVVLSIEAKQQPCNNWEAYTDCGREHSGKDVVDWAREAIDLGVGEILITSVDRDGMRSGYDHELIKAITAFAPVPVIAHGGAGSIEDTSTAVLECQPDALALASLLHYNETTIPQIKQHLQQSGINVRAV